MDIRPLGQVIGAVLELYEIPGRGYRLGRYPCGVGPHVGYESHRPLVSELHAFIELLGEHHGLLGGKPELPCGLLLELARRKRSRGVPLRLFGLDLGYLVRSAFQLSECRLGVIAVIELYFLAVLFGKLGREGVSAKGLEPGGNRPVLPWDKGLYLPFTIAYEAHRYRLDPSGGQAPSHLVPEYRAYLIAHQPVQNSPCLLGLVLVLVEGYGVGYRLLHGLLGYLVKQDPRGLLVLLVYLFGDMPGNGLALSVRVRREEYPVRALAGLLQFLYGVRLALYGLVMRLEAVFNIDAELGLRQVFYMADRGHHNKVLAQELVYGLGFCRRLNYYKRFSHSPRYLPELLLFSLKSSGLNAFK